MQSPNLNHNIMDITLVDYVKSLGAVSLRKVEGPNGAFISYTLADGATGTLPIGNKSKSASLREYRMLVATDGSMIATASSYKESETMSL